MQPKGEDTKSHQRFLAVGAQITPTLRDALATVGPVTLPDRSTMSLWRFLAHAIVGQQLSTRAAATIRTRLQEAAEARGCPLPAFAAEADDEVLRACGLSRAKSRSLRELARVERSGTLEHLATGSPDHAALTAELTPIHGIGQWTCDMAAIFWARCPDVWPETDVAVQRTFTGLIGRRRKPTRAAARFSPQRSWLARYMWRITDTEPDRG